MKSPIAAIVAGSALLAGCSGSAEPETQMITGLAALHDDDLGDWWETCAGQGEYSDFAAGSAVVIRDSAGDIIATARTRSLTTADLPEDGDTPIAEATTAELGALIGSMAWLSDRSPCYLYFEVEVAPSDFYSFELTSRGEVVFSAADLEQNGWRAELSLGSAE